MIQKITLTDSSCDADYLAALSSAIGDFCLTLQVHASNAHRSTGMIGIPSGTITVNDIARLLEATIPSEYFSNDCIASPRLQFVLDDKLKTDILPVGMRCKRLEVMVTYARGCVEKVQRWFDWATALNRTIVGWDVEILERIDD